MSIHYESVVFGDIRAAGMHGRAGVGLSELLFSLEWTIHSTREEVLQVFGTSAWIYVQPFGTDQLLFLGHANPESAWCSETRNHPTNTTLFYRLLLPHPQMLAVEELRHGRELVFTLDVRGNSLGPRGVRLFDQKLTHRVTPSDWVRILRDASVADVLLVGIHVPDARVDGILKSPIDLIRRANEHLTLGHYSSAVADCRLAIESLWKGANLTEGAREARKLLAKMDLQMTMSKRDRELALGEALRIYCHRAHHVGQDAAPEDFGRVDAALAVGTTAALISSLASDPGLASSIETKAKSVVELKKIGVATPKEAGTKDKVERVALVLEHLTKRPSNRPSSITALRSLLESLFRGKLPNAELDTLVAELKSRGVIRLNGKKLEYDLANGDHASST